MTLAQSAMRGIIHDQKRSPAFDTKLEDTYNMGMDQVGNRTGLGTELVHIIAGQLSMEYFDGRLGPEVNMFSQIDLCEATFSQQANQLIVAKLLPYVIGHPKHPF